MGPDKAAFGSVGTNKLFPIIVLFPVVKEEFISFTQVKAPILSHKEKLQYKESPAFKSYLGNLHPHKKCYNPQTLL